MNDKSIERQTEILQVHINDLKKHYSYEQLLFHLKKISSIIEDDIKDTDKFNTKEQYTKFFNTMKRAGIYNKLIDK